MSFLLFISHYLLTLLVGIYKACLYSDNADMVEELIEMGMPVDHFNGIALMDVVASVNLSFSSVSRVLLLLPYYHYRLEVLTSF